MRLRRKASKNVADHSFKPKMLCMCVRECVVSKLSACCLCLLAWPEPVPTTYDMRL